MAEDYPDIPAILEHRPERDKSLPCEIFALYGDLRRVKFCEIDELAWSQELVRRWNAGTRIIATVNRWMSEATPAGGDPQSILSAALETTRMMPDHIGQLLITCFVLASEAAEKRGNLRAVRPDPTAQECDSHAAALDQLADFMEEHSCEGYSAAVNTHRDVAAVLRRAAQRIRELEAGRPEQTDAKG